ncbi:hypothetical protein Tco_0003803 [Tanacetum coccineum]
MCLESAILDVHCDGSMCGDDICDASQPQRDGFITYNETATNSIKCLSYYNHFKMSTLAEFMIVAGADNRPPMLDKPMYESWKSRMELYIQGLPPNVYSLINHHKVAKDIWDRVKLLMQGTSFSKQERECKLYDEFDKFTYVKGESMYEYYLRLPPKWSKFVTDVKLARDLHTSYYAQLYAYLEQHEAHVNEARLMRERFPEPLSLVANYHQPPSHFNNYHSQYTTSQYQQQFSPPAQQQLLLMCNKLLFHIRNLLIQIIYLIGIFIN